MRRLFPTAAWPVIAVLLLAMTTGSVTEARQKQAQSRSPFEALLQSIAHDDGPQAAMFLDRVLQAGTSVEKDQARALAGRVALMRGDTKTFEAIAAAMRRGTLDENATRLLAAYEAWAIALDGRTDDARTALEALLAAQSDCPSTADVAEILARVQAMRQDADGIRRAVEFGRTFCKYHGPSQPYLEPLFRRHLEQAAAIGKDPGAALFQKAEAARQAKKWSVAASLYERVVREHPASPLAHPSGFWLGDCFRSEGKASRAVTLWEQFIESDPFGPWRGQAHVGLIDAAMEGMNDFAQADTRVSFALAALDQPRPAGAETSWREAAGEIHVRHGLLELIRERHESAARAFQTAKQCVQALDKQRAGGSTAAEIERLIAFTAAGTPLVPSDAKPSGNGVGATLALGCAYEVMVRWGKACEVLAPIAKGRATGVSAEQRSYAAFVLARAMESEGKVSEAIAEYRHSLGSGQKKTWHPEGLHRLALLLERSARPPVRTESATTARKDGPPRPAPQALNEAMSAWRTLIQDYPESPRAEPALYHAGCAAAALGNEKEAIALWTRQLAESPRGIYAGMAHADLVGFTLEVLLDLTTAKDRVRAGLEWYAERAPQAPNLGEKRSPRPSDWPNDPAMKPDHEIGFQLHRYAGLIAFLSGDNERAVEMFRSAGALEGRVQEAADKGHATSGMTRLMEAAQANRELVPKEVLEGGDRGKLCLQLAACSYTAEEFEHVFELTERVMQERSQVSPQQRAWARFLHGRANHGAMRPIEAIEDFRKALAEAHGASWAAQCQFYVANSTFTYEKNIPAAIREWQQLVRRYPDSEHAERAAYHVGVAQQVAGQFSEAERSYESFVKAYPTSPFVRPIQSHHLPRIRAQSSAQP
jgi:TolA-binding protein